MIQFGCTSFGEKLWLVHILTTAGRRPNKHISWYLKWLSCPFHNFAIENPRETDNHFVRWQSEIIRWMDFNIRSTSTSVKEKIMTNVFRE
jgi:hypothetical protein